ncbi:RING-like zinc finger/Ring finger domain/Zinc finger, C3HC4 type (RING finger)/RING-type zinc-finger containing protein, putative [Leishmania lindenbergi]|uniref:RING-like zinc finger/Ring finger domain/Zinc finger, C3HC4 type (RING finger) n=1 Tax=Leishmania lindenbergi TaxID=651832 RepID=A0AAW3AFK0_9TRYP
MPVIGYNCDSGAVVEVVNPAGGELGFAEKTVISGGVVSAASAGNGALYYLPTSAPSMLRRHNLESGEDEMVQDLVGAHTQVFFHRNKVICIPAGNTGVTVYDPLCNVAEVIALPYRLICAEPADNGFVFRSECNRVFGYDFNKGLTEVMNGSNIARFLGHYKRYAVALLHDADECVVGVTEAGSIVELDVTLPRVRFTSLDDIVLHTHENQVVSSKSGSAASPIGELQLSSSQPTDSEVLCTVCLCEFDSGDGVTLDCGHYFHKECIDQWVTNWMDFTAKGEHVTFTRALCPGGCKHLVRHPLVAQSKQISELYADVSSKMAEELKSCEATKTEEDLLFYICGRCGNAFYGGLRMCSRMQGREPSSPPQDLVCDTCLTKGHKTCNTLTAVFKCRYCCNPATQRSFGTRFICDRCIARWDTAEPALIPCSGADNCPFDGNHPDPPCDIAGCLTCLDPAIVDHIFDRVVRADADACGGVD